MAMKNIRFEAIRGVAVALAVAAIATGCFYNINSKKEKRMEIKPHIVAKIADADAFAHLNPLFPKAFEFLKRPDLASLAVGKYDIVPGKCWAMVQEVELTPVEGHKVEAHRKYIDIQAPLSAPETHGLAVMDDEKLALPFNEKDDYVLFDAVTKPVTLQPGDFALFFPPLGAHAPGCIAGSERKIKKLVIKVLAE